MSSNGGASSGWDGGGGRGRGGGGRGWRRPAQWRGSGQQQQQQQRGYGQSSSQQQQQPQQQQWKPQQQQPHSSPGRPPKRQSLVAKGQSTPVKQQPAWNQSGRGRRRNSGGWRDSGSISTGQESDLPGFYRDPATGKYFAIAKDGSGLSGFERSNFAAKQRQAREEKEYQEERKRAEEERVAREKKMAEKRPINIALLTRGMQIPPSCSLRASVGEAMLKAASDSPSQVITIPSSSSHGRIIGCEFLDVSSDGINLTGCWAMSESGRDDRDYSSAYVLQAGIEDDRRDGRPGEIELKPMARSIHVAGNAVVDVAMAPADRDVTCLLYSTALLRHDRHGHVEAYCKVETSPVIAPSGEFDVSRAPIYNNSIQRREIYSTAWSEASTAIAIGMDKQCEIIDLISDEKRSVWTGHGKHVNAMAFDRSGNLLVLGLTAANAALIDLRLPRRSESNAGMRVGAYTMTMPDSFNTCWIRPLRRRPHEVVLSTFDGKLHLYDVRNPATRLLSYSGHRNSHSKAPCFVDDDEDYVFAVGNDARTRVWSLRGGALLHEWSMAAPTSPSTGRPYSTDLPRPVYSARWGGRQGTPAVLIAQGPIVNVYRMRLGDEPPLTI